MVLDIDQPDILIQTFYFFDKNPNFKGTNVIMVNKEPIYRYNFTQSKMESFPFLGNSAAEAEAEYLLQFGFRMIDQAFVPGRIIWECEANELLEDSYRLEEYARIHAPLMLMQYPYVKYGRNVQYKVSQKPIIIRVSVTISTAWNWLRMSTVIHRLMPPAFARVM